VVRGGRPFASYIAIDPQLNQAINHMMDLRTEPVFDACLALLKATAPAAAAAPEPDPEPEPEPEPQAGEADAASDG